MQFCRLRQGGLIKRSALGPAFRAMTPEIVRPQILHPNQILLRIMSVDFRRANPVLRQKPRDLDVVPILRAL